MVLRFLISLLSLVVIFLPVGRGAATAAKALPAGNWEVVLAAGDDAEPVFDNATRTFNQRLVAAGVPAGDTHRLSASPAELS